MMNHLQYMARVTSAHIFLQQNGTFCYLDGKNIVHRKVDEDTVASDRDCDETAVHRMASLAVLLEHQADYAKDETYCVVVTDWTKRAEDIAQFASDTLDTPLIPMIITPHIANDAFSGEAIFLTDGGQIANDAFSEETIFPTEGGHRSAALFGLFDRER